MWGEPKGRDSIKTKKNGWKYEDDIQLNVVTVLKIPQSSRELEKGKNKETCGKLFHGNISGLEKGKGRGGGDGEQAFGLKGINIRREKGLVSGKRRSCQAKSAVSEKKKKGQGGAKSKFAGGSRKTMGENLRDSTSPTAGRRNKL